MANSDWARQFDTKQRACAASGTRYYGDGGTVHGSTVLDIETRDGKVVAVWFRCQALPFGQVEVDRERAAEMESMYKSNWIPPEVHGVELKDKS